ncbi:pectate lyase family protein [Caldalkalibacillus salinus]|uniref:pectate lyase family protein n=1 Tax=Caldalkalibacillus salinus TaxID=2803787 RepID=UPI0019221E71|nr:pectate lyase [Caldalkalibacillus salinus]
MRKFVSLLLIFSLFLTLFVYLPSLTSRAATLDTQLDHQDETVQQGDQMNTKPSINADAPIGFASMNGGTTGGEGGREEYVSTGAELQQIINERSRSAHPHEPLTIYVQGTITQSNSSKSSIELKHPSGKANEIRNVSIIGVGTQGEFDGIGLRLINAHNIIVRNLSIHHVSAGEGTAIEVTENSSNVWIDHNDLYSQLDGNDDRDYYDGLVDIKRGTEYVTVSWNKIHDHWKTALIGHTDDESLAADKVTYHHNHWYNINSRGPLIRFADVHIFNNYYEDVHDTAINSRMGARVYVENNYFENVGDGGTDGTTGHVKGPVGWYYGSSETGYWHLSGNIYVNTPSDHLQSTTNYVPPYSYTPNTAEEAKSLVQQYAGVGVIN